MRVFRHGSAAPNDGASLVAAERAYATRASGQWKSCRRAEERWDVRGQAVWGRLERHQLRAEGFAGALQAGGGVISRGLVVVR